MELGTTHARMVEKLQDRIAELRANNTELKKMVARRDLRVAELGQEADDSSDARSVLFEALGVDSSDWDGSKAGAESVVRDNLKVAGGQITQQQWGDVEEGTITEALFTLRARVAELEAELEKANGLACAACCARDNANHKIAALEAACAAKAVALHHCRKAMAAWGDEEDGIPNDSSMNVNPWEAYKEAQVAMPLKAGRPFLELLAAAREAERACRGHAAGLREIVARQKSTGGRFDWAADAQAAHWEQVAAMLDLPLVKEEG